MDIRHFLCVALLATLSLAVDHDTFRTCEQVDFCSRLRSKEPATDFHVVNDSAQVSSHSIFVNLHKASTDEIYLLNISAIEGDIFRVQLEEVSSNTSRYSVSYALDGEPDFADFSDISLTGNISAAFGDGNRVIAYASPLKLEFYKNDVLVAVLDGSRLSIESGTGEAPVAFNVEFPNALRTYGIPLHADQLPLRSTQGTDSDPYRLYNLDVAYYELDSPMALYGAIPLVYGHGPNYTSGVFFLNAAELWVDIQNNTDGQEAYFIAESGAFDVFILLGPTPENVAKQYTSLTGVAPLPQYWSLGYHQCRWNYDSDEDVKYVVSEFDNNDFPIDVIWLDIEYTDEKKYFTWDLVNFTDPLEMQANLSATDRKLVVIIDPHYKVEDGYFVYDGALANGYFVVTANGTVFEGDCWPGLSSYFDFLNPNASAYYSSLYAYDKFNYTTPTLAGIWNDMNEPSVFDDDAEKTLPKDAIHYGNVQHRDVHNSYGFLQTRGTYQGLIDRDNGELRPFILTRSHFAGSQRYAGVWTGDNTADWGYLAVSYPMCLAENLAGISFCGADVGGFFENPDVQLFQRWYQAGVWLPFYRAHANLGTDRREPYLFPEDVQERLRSAMRLRYAHIPVFYTLFFEHYRYGTPVIRPLFYHYPQLNAVLDIDNQLLVGRNILARAISQPNVTSVTIYFPGGSQELWYDVENTLLYSGNGNTVISVTLDKSPYYYRGGSIISRKDTPRRNTAATKNDTYSVYILASYDDQAEGTIYIDDHETFDYQNGEFNYIGISFSNGTISLSNLVPEASYEETFNVGSYVLYRPPSGQRATDGPIVPERLEFHQTIDGQPISELRFNRNQGTIRLY